MKFLIQSIDNMPIDTEGFALMKSIDKQYGLHSYELMDMEGLNSLGVDGIKYIPVGNLEFVGLWLGRYHEIDSLYPIEVPKSLREDEFLGRKYSIITADKIPNSGRYFLKNVSVLKTMSYCGELSYFMHDKIFEDGGHTNELRLDKTHLYQLSEEIEILSEYRIIVLNDVIEAIRYYDGDILLFPDRKTIEKMVLLISLDKERPKAYTLDVGITTYGTIIIEQHAFVSCGTYGFWGDSLPYLYKYGLDYYINHNKPIELFSNF